MRKIDYLDPTFNKEEVTNLYVTAFPEDERPPVNMFYSSLKTHQENRLFSYYEKDEFIGFTYLIFYKDIIYLFFLAIKEEKRNQGYGTKILSDVKDSYPDKVILLCYEEVDESYPDYENRKRREKFYLRNGFIRNGLDTDEYGVIFTSAYYGNHKVPFEDYLNIFLLGFGGPAKKYIKIHKIY